MHSNMSTDWTLLQLCTEYGFKDRVTDISIGDLPPKSPDFSNMLPSLRSSPLLLSKSTTEEQHDSFHVVPSTYTPDLDTCTETDTYDSFLKHLEKHDVPCDQGNFALSPEDFTVPEDFSEQQENSGLFGSEDLQIYLPNEISPTPVERLYSTLPGEEEAPKTFTFPSLDENQRLENFDLERSISAAKTETQCVTRPADISKTNQASPVCFTNIAHAQPCSQKRKYITKELAHKREKQFRSQNRKGNEKPTHNDIERQRRNDMKARFDALKATIPDIVNLERTPKIMVLSQATQFIKKLHAKENQLDIEKEKERQRNRILLERLVQLTNL